MGQLGQRNKDVKNLRRERNMYIAQLAGQLQRYETLYDLRYYGIGAAAHAHMV